TVPPLRERREDVPQLIAHFYRAIARTTDAPPAELITRLLRQSWAGNVRELRSAVERAVVLGESAAATDAVVSLGAALRPSADGWPSMDFTQSFRDSKEAAVAVWTRVYVREL